MIKMKVLVLVFLMMLVPKAYADDNLIIKSGKIKHHYTVEIADNDLSREKGLMFRTQLASDHGMLFVFKNIDVQNFWMKNTLIPLDIVFVTPDGKIAKIHDMAQPEDLTLISSDVPIAAAIELKGGEAQKSHLKVGNIVIHPIFANNALKPVAKP